MDIKYLLVLIIPTVLGIVTGIISFFGKQQMRRIDDLETRTASFITEAQVRQIQKDNVEPVRRDLEKVQEKLDKIFFNLLKMQE